MLILTRRCQEVIWIGDNIAVKILHINGNQVQIGIEAPKQIIILREEVYLRDKKIN